MSRRYIDTHARGSAFVEIDCDLAAALVEVNDPHGRIDRREAMSAGFENATTKSVEVNGAPFIFRIAAKKRFDQDDVFSSATPLRVR